jgi:predicted PurR-regulated permease PerM
VLILALLAATAAAFYLCYLLARPFLPALAWGLALAVVGHPLHEWIADRVPRASLAAGLSVTILAATIVAPAFLVTQRLVGQAAHSLETIKAETTGGRWRAAIERNPQLAPVLHWFERQLNLRNAVERAWAAVTARISAFVSGSVWMIAQLLITFFALFYFFRDRRQVLRALRSLLPLSATETDEVFKRVADTIQATIYGTLVVAIVQGTLGGLMFWWLGLPAPFLWGTVMALLAIVPVLGAFVLWVPAAIFLALEGNWGNALILTAWGSVVIALIDNLLYPVLVGKRLRLHTLPVFISILGGLALFGASGLILGPLTLAVTVALVDVWRRRTLGGRTAEAGVAVVGRH